MTELDEFEIKRPLPNGWRMSEEYSESRKTADEKEEFDRIVKEMLAMPRPKPNLPTHFEGKLVKDLTGEAKERFIFSLQSPGTQAAMLAQKDRKPEDDNAWLLRDMPNHLAVPGAKNIEDAVAERRVSPREFDIVERNRRGQKNTRFDSSRSGTSKETRTRAIEAFTYSRPADLQDSEIARIKKLRELEAVVAAAPEKEKEGPKEYNPGPFMRMCDWIQSWPLWWW